MMDWFKPREPGAALRAAFSILCFALPGSLGGRALGADALALELAGDRAQALAVPFLRSAVAAWERVAVDPTAQERSQRERRVLATLLHDARLLELLTPAGGSQLRVDVDPSPRPLLVDAGAPGGEALDRLLRGLRAAARKLSSRGERAPGDELHLVEAEAWVERLRGEVHLLAGAEAYTQALSALPAAPAPASIASSELYRRGKLLHKLFKLAAARVALEKAGAASPPLRREEDLDRLRRLRAIALASGDTMTAKALALEVDRRGGAAEETAKPMARFPSLLGGSVIELADSVRTLEVLLGRQPLSARARAVLALLLGDAALELGEPALAEEALRGVTVKDAGAREEDSLRLSVLSRLGFARAQLGDYEAAVVSLEEARALARAAPGSQGVLVRVGLNLSRALLGLGEIDRARSEALEVLKSRGASAEMMIRARILLATCLHELARVKPETLADAESTLEAAQRELEAARARDKGFENGEELEAMIAINLGNVSRWWSQRLTGPAAEARRQKALTLEARALRGAEAAKLWPLAAIASANLGELHLEAGDIATASPFIAWALERAREYHLFETEWRCRWYQGRVAVKGGREAEAAQGYAQAARVLESYRSRILDAERKSGFFSDKLDFFRDWVEWELARGRPDLALAVCERAKARALVDSLGWRFVALADPGESSLYREYVGLLGKAERARDHRPGQVFGLETRSETFESLRAKLAALKQRLTSSPEYGPSLRALIDGDPAETPKILAELPAGAVLVEYFATARGLLAFLARPSGVEAIRLPATAAEVDALVYQFVGSNAGNAELARKLHRILIAPLEPGLSAVERLIVVPYGSLHQLPFETLRDDSGYLVARFSCSYLPSASALRHLRRTARDSHQARLFAVVDPDTDYNRDGKPDMPPLPHARAEVAGFAASFPQRVVLEGSAAIKLSCQEQVAGFDVIHYACHGEFYPARPWDSTLFLSSGVVDGRQDDGRLRAAEVYTLDLRKSSLVALSGCETGRSQVAPGDDAVSIGAAFLHSGASSLLVSLWKVEDQATAVLMKAFYSKWIGDKKNKSQALRESKLELLAQGYAHPRQWGAFVLLGDS